MADVKISALPAASALTGTELVPIVQGGVTVQSTPAAFVSNGTLAVSGTNLSYTGTLTGGTGVVNIGSGQLVKDASGNLGIGTSTPGSVLDIQKATGEMRLTSTTGTNAVWTRYSNTGGFMYVGAENSTGTTFGIGTAYAGVVYVNGANPLAFATSGAERMRLDASGNLGLGVTPSAWTSGASALEQSAGAIYSITSGTWNLAQNAYNSSTGLKYKNTAFASLYRQTSGQHVWFNAPSGTAGNAITFTQAMTLDASGRLLVGTTTAAAKLTVDSLGDAYAVFSGRNSSTVGGDVQIKRSSSSTAIGTGPNIYFDDGTPNNTNLIQAGSGNLQFFNFSAGSWTERMRLDSSGNLITTVNAAAPSLSTNSTMSFELTSNTSLKVVVRGTDGVTRSVSLTLS